MNWTGGRLHRHSATNGPPHAKPKRHTPKKSRLNVPQGPRQVTLFHKQLQTKDLHSDENTCKEDNHEQSSNTPLLPLSPHQKKQSSTRLDRIKRQLLEKTDWAAVSAARPLKITFPPPEELAQFGKRRKLTDADRRRLDKTDHRASRAEVVPLFRRACLRDATPSEVGTNEGLEIRINGKRAGGSAAGGLREYNVSSQSMLLDREVSELPQTPRVEDVVSDYMPPSEYSLGVPDYHSRRTSLLSSPPGNTWISQLRYLSGYFSG